MRVSGRLTFIIGCALLASCGGEDSNTPPPTGGGGTPTPSPTPTPTPSPTPTPTLFSALVGDQQFNSACAGSTEQFGTLGVFNDVGFIRSSTFPLAIDHDFLDATDSWRIASRSPDGADYSYTFGPADIIATAQPDTIAYRQPDPNNFPNRFSITQPTLGSVKAEYVRSTRVFNRPANLVTNAFCVIGVPTEVTDRPPALVTYTTFAFDGTAFLFDRANGNRRQFDLSESTAQWTANPATGQINVTLTLTGREFLSGGGLSDTRTAMGTYPRQAVIDGTVQTFSVPFDTVSGGPTTITGGFSGWFFGPAGIEAGLAFSGRADFDTNTNLIFGGSLTARR